MILQEGKSHFCEKNKWHHKKEQTHSLVKATIKTRKKECVPLIRNIAFIACIQAPHTTRKNSFILQ